MRLLLRAASVAAGMMLLFLVFKDVDFSEMSSRLADVGFYFIPIFAVYGVGCLFDTAAWKLILAEPEKSISFSRLYQIHLAGESMYRFIPAGMVVGEASKVYLLTKQSRYNGSEAVSSLVIRKLLMGLSQGLYIGVGVLAGVLLAQKFGQLELLLSAVSLGVIVVFASLWIKLSHGELFGWLFRLLLRMPVLGARVVNNKLFFERTDSELKSFLAENKRRGILAFLLFFCGWLTEAFETYLIIVVLGMKILPYQVMIFEPVVSLVRSLAFFVPAGLGIMDSGYVSAFGSVGIVSVVTAGAAFIIIKRSKELFWILIGLFLLWLQGGGIAERMLVQPVQPEIAAETV
jgi:uncharacterized membrane protein YbhN (UPF0104 family)